MRVTNFVCATVCIIGCGVKVFGAPLAEWSGDAAGGYPPISASMRHEEGPGLLPTDRVYATAGTNKFSFLVPLGYKMETWSDGRVALVNKDYSRQITFRIASPLPMNGGELDNEIFSGRVLAEHPGAKILKVTSGMADSRRGPAIEIQCTGTGGAPRRAQIAYIPSWSWVLEFSLICSPDKYEEARHQFNTVMLTFRASDPKGDLHISPISDKL